MKVDFSTIKGSEFYVWGNGNLFSRYFDSLKKINIKAVIDSNKDKWGSLPNYNKLRCISPEEAISKFPVIVAIEDPVVINEITQILDTHNFSWCHIIEVVDLLYIEGLKEYTNPKFVDDHMMHKFIDVMLPVANCNLGCDYCYLSQLNVDNRHLPNIYHQPQFIRYALRKNRIGGTAFINICGIGETLLCKELVPIVCELTKEGHYIQIVTNATITKTINCFIASDINPEQLFFKCSLHWEELKNRGLLNRFADNINSLRKHGFSFTLELVPNDKIIDQIPEIKEYCINNFGGLPHVTVTRDESKKDFPIITNYSEEEYEKIWSTFDSSMFDFKMKNRGKTRYQNCYAGLWAAELNLATGELYKCTGNPRICNIYEKPEEPIPFEKVGSRCCLPYCFNCHAYLTLGLVPEVIAPNYLEMRDRTTPTGEHWINGKIRNIFKQKLYDNNSEKG